MLSSGPRSPTTTADESLGGVLGNWANRTYVMTEDGNCAAQGGSYTGEGFTNYVKTTNYGFNVPSNATINGIVVEVKKFRYQAAPPDQTCKDYSVKMVKGGTTSGTDKASASAWGTSLAYATYGSSSDLWGLSWSPSDINSTGFGVSFSASIPNASPSTTYAYVDHIRITVYYTISGPANIKSYNGIAAASVKSINGVDIANIKSWNGVT